LLNSERKVLITLYGSATSSDLVCSGNHDDRPPHGGVQQYRHDNPGHHGRAPNNDHHCSDNDDHVMSSVEHLRHFSDGPGEQRVLWGRKSSLRHAK
jgi:hypothetical protein